MDSKKTWLPVGPLMVSGSKDGKCWDSMLFQDPRVLMKRYLEIRRLARRLSSDEQYIVWLWEEARAMESIQKCSFCEERPIAFFLVTYDEGGKATVNQSQTCCGQRECNAKLRQNITREKYRVDMGDVPSDFYRLKFESFGERLFRSSRNRKAPKGLFAWAFGIEKEANFGAQELYQTIYSQWKSRQQPVLPVDANQLSLSFSF